ncbi:hypothetical protein FPQ18DRAFT_397622 [Pyronema domesticum]|nr:hypothetical protein FPQ18DRAFT_397622 [Pyronema domesticum]
MQSLRRLLKVFEFSLNLSSCELLSKTSQQLEENQKKMMHTLRSFEELTGSVSLEFLEKSNELSKAVQIAANLANENSIELKEMAVTSGAKRHQDIRAKWLKGKGNWFLESEEFRNWRNSEDQGGSKVFTCYGMPGAGKVGNEELLKEVASSDPGAVCVAYVCCDYRDAEACICIDALDECKDEYRKRMLESLGSLLQDSATNSSLRLFLTGRPYVEAHANINISDIDNQPPLSMTLKADPDDIRAYVSRQMEAGDYKEDYTMPKKVDDAFGVTITRIHSQTKARANQAMEVLKWTLLAERQMTVAELRHALAVTPGDS